jgi:hypothetical protein
MGGARRLDGKFERPPLMLASTMSARPGSKIGISLSWSARDAPGVLIDHRHLVTEIGKAGAHRQAQ